MADRIIKKIGVSLDQLPLTKADAASAGSKWFFTRQPCGSGHLEPRTTSSGTCMECHRLAAGLRYTANIERLKEYARNRGKALRADNPDEARRISREGMRSWRARNPDKALEATRTFAGKNADRIREQARARHAAEPDRFRAKVKRWRDANPDKVRDQFRAWCTANPDEARAKERNRRARKKNAEGRHTAMDIERIAKLQSGRCACCRVKLTAKTRHIDHIVALAKGGTNDPRNLQLLCLRCNCSKGAKDPIDFMQQQGLLL